MLIYIVSTVEASRKIANRPSEQSLNNSWPNTKEQQVLIRATGKNPEPNHLHYAVNRRVAGSNPA
jgi:hypothetical protein